MKLSACWIVKNEAEELAASINSVKECADELIVVDTGSTDGTVEIAKKLGARVEHFEWIDDFSAARNFALSLAKGKYVIFLDADEYFSPALVKTDRNSIADFFRQSGAGILQVTRIELDTDTGKIIGSAPQTRILMRTAVRYENRIHELPVTKDGKPPFALLVHNYRLIHTGYSADRVKNKYLRNIRYLETQQKELVNELDLFHNHAYLMREYMAVDDYDNAVKNCRYLLDNYEKWDPICKKFCSSYIRRFYTAINLAFIKRPQFSRKEVYKKLVQPMKCIYSGSGDAAIIELYYQMIFDYRGNRFLAELENTDKVIAGMPEPDAAESRNAQAAVYGRGALEAYYRGEWDTAKQFAETALKILPEGNTAVMSALADRTFTGTDTIGKSIIQGNYETAFAEINKGFDGNPLDYRLLDFLLIIAEAGKGNLSASAKKLYDTKRALLDEVIDSNDVINTGYID